MYFLLLVRGYASPVALEYEPAGHEVQVEEFIDPVAAIQTHGYLSTERSVRVMQVV
jgi:hypothetical protein